MKSMVIRLIDSPESDCIEYTVTDTSAKSIRKAMLRGTGIESFSFINRNIKRIGYLRLDTVRLLTIED